MAVEQRAGESVLLQLSVILVLCLSICSARPLPASIKAPKGHQEENGIVEIITFQSDLQSVHGVEKGRSIFIGFKLEKGSVSPSGPSPIHNTIPTDSSSAQP